MYSAVYLLTNPGAPTVSAAMLRRYVRPEQDAEDPDIATREALALRVAEAADVPTRRYSRPTGCLHRPGSGRHRHRRGGAVHRLWQHAVGVAYHLWANVVTTIGFLDDLRGAWRPERLLVEDMLARAVADLGGTSR